MSAALGLIVLLSVNSLGFNTGFLPVVEPNPIRLASFEWQTIASPQYAGEPFGVVILAKDENGASYPYNGSALLSTTRGPYVLPPVVRFNNGVCDTSVVVTLAESLALRCFTDSASGTSDVFEVLPGVPKRLVAILPGEQLAPGVPGGRSGLANSQVAGDTFSFDVYLTDDWFNRIGLRNDSVYFGSDDRFARLPDGGQLSNGTGSFTGSLRTAGLRRVITIPALGSSLRNDTSSAVHVVTGPFKEMLLVAPGEALMPGDTAIADPETPGKSGTPTSQYLRVPFPVVVYPCDRCWNRVTGPGDIVVLKSDRPDSCSPPEAVLTDSALFSFQLNQPGDNSVWVRDNLTKAESYITHVNVRARGALLEVTAPDTVRSGETTLVLIRVLDANGVPVVATLVQTSVTKGSGRMLVPALLTDTLGFASGHFLCTPSPASERDSIRVSSGDADTVIGIYVSHLSDSLFAFPNPFGSINSDRTLISYYLQRSSSVTTTIYDPFGNKVWSRHFNQGEPGARSGDNVVYWDGTNNRGHRVASGIYLVQLLGSLHTGIEYKSTYRIGVVW